jgi:hypothetical protein
LATNVATMLYQHVFKLHGLPRQIISDRGTQFAAKVFQEFCQNLGIKSSMSTAYHPQTDGQTERVNQSLENYLRIFCNHRQNDWEYFLPTAEFAYNNAAHELTKLSPFFVETGWNPRMAPDIVSELSHPSLEQLFHDQLEAQDKAKALLALSAERMKWYYNQARQEPPFKVGDFVLLKGKDLKIRAANTKLAAKNYGPYKITNQLGPTTFKLALPAKSQQHPVFHASKFIWYHHDTIGKRKPTNPPPLQIEGHNKFEVEAILDSKVHYRKVKYLVKWKGYDHSHNSWEPISHMSNSKALVKKFHNNHPDAPKPILWTNPHSIAALFVRNVFNYASTEFGHEGGVMSQFS